MPIKETDWKKELKILKLANIKQKAPGFYELSGGDGMKVKPYNDNNANSLTRCIIDFINFNGGTATRISSTGMMRKVNGKMIWTKGNVRKGVADIHAVGCGRHLSIEVKIGPDKPSPQQEEEKKRIERAGGLYFIAKDFPSFRQWYSKQFVESKQIS